MGGFVRFDERQDVMVSLEHCVMSLQQSEQLKGAWKWVVLSLHSAFQGAMVCHLTGTMQIGALEEKCAKKWCEWYSRHSRGEIEYVPDGVDELGLPKTRIKYKKDHPPKIWVASPLELLDRLGSMEKRFEEAGRAISITDQQKESFKDFNDELRNKFTHFSPRGWSIEIEFIKERMKDILDIFDMIIEDPNPYWHMSCDEKNALCSEIAVIRSFL